MSRTTRRTLLLVQLPISPPGSAPVCGNAPLAAVHPKLLAERQGLGRSHAIEVFPSRQANALGN